jgi:uncharacterized protein (DUF2237 family)
MTGFMRTGYCEAPKQDAGNHSIAGTSNPHSHPPSIHAYGDSVSNTSYRNRSQVGLTDGCKWCLCVNRWKEAFDARTGENDKKVPKIVLKATNERALEGVGMEDLRKFAVDKE